MVVGGGLVLPAKVLRTRSKGRPILLTGSLRRTMVSHPQGNIQDYVRMGLGAVIFNLKIITQSPNFGVDPIFGEGWWWEADSNHRRVAPADLQSAPVGHLGIPPIR